MEDDSTDILRYGRNISPNLILKNREDPGITLWVALWTMILYGLKNILLKRAQNIFEPATQVVTVRIKCSVQIYRRPCIRVAVEEKKTIMVCFLIVRSSTGRRAKK